MKLENKIILEDRHIMWDRDTVLEVMGVKGVSTLYRAIKNSDFPSPIRVGRLSRWRKSEVLEWLDSRPQGLEHEFQ